MNPRHTPPHHRRALEHQGGPAVRHGDSDVAAQLATALEAVNHTPTDPLTHGFHTYPARMHYAIARSVLTQWADPRTRVLDPFCGSGTVLVEARRLGLRGCGVDLNPIGLRLSEIKCAYVDEPLRRAFMKAAAEVVEASFDRVSRRERVRAPLGPDEQRWYQPHVLLELAGLHAEIQAREAGFVRRALAMVFSSMVVKFSKQQAETQARVVDKRIGKKVVTGFFDRKAKELAQRWAALADDTSALAPAPRLEQGDARHLKSLLGGWRFDIVLSSPPYGGTYDYVEHHARRFPWFGISPHAWEPSELGARRRLSKGPGVVRQWESEIETMLRSIASVLSSRGRVALLVGDGEVGGRRIEADQQLANIAGRAGLVVVASASAERPDWRGRAPRREHLVALQPRAK